MIGLNCPAEGPQFNQSNLGTKISLDIEPETRWEPQLVERSCIAPRFLVSKMRHCCVHGNEPFHAPHTQPHEKHVPIPPGSTASPSRRLNSLLSTRASRRVVPGTCDPAACFTIKKDTPAFHKTCQKVPNARSAAPRVDTSSPNSNDARLGLRFEQHHARSAFRTA